MKKLSYLCQVSTLALLLATASANAGGWVCALDGAMSDKPMSSVVELNDHKFLVRPVQVTDGLKSQHTLSGTIEYALKDGKNNVVKYQVVKKGGTVKEITLQINDGKWVPAGDALMKALENFGVGKPMTEEQQNDTFRSMGKTVDKSWEKTVELIIATIGVRHC